MRSIDRVILAVGHGTFVRIGNMEVKTIPVAAVFTDDTAVMKGPDRKKGFLPGYIF